MFSDIISTNILVNVPAMLITSGNVVNPIRRIGMSILTDKHGEWFRNIPRDSGIYCVTNTINGKRYIGSAFNLRRRAIEHFSRLGQGVHVNKHLQASFNKYGVEHFRFDVLELCDKDVLIQHEQKWIDNICPEYNKRKIASSNAGITFAFRAAVGEATEETRQKMSLAHKGKRFSDEHKEKIRFANLGHKLSEEAKEKIRNSLKGRAPSDAARVGASKAHKGRKKSDETRKKMSAAAMGNQKTLGYKYTPESLIKMSAAQIKAWVTRKAKRREAEND